MPRDGFSALDLDELKSLLSQAYKDPPMFAATGTIRGFRRGYRIVTRIPREEYL